jgi:integrase
VIPVCYPFRSVRSGGAVGKNSKPFLRGKTKSYYCWVEGRLLSLRTDRQRLAEQRYRELIANPNPHQNKSWTVRECLDYYLAFSEATHKRNTFKDRVHSFRRFCGEMKVGDLPWKKLTADHVDRWAAKHPAWSSSMKRSVFCHLLAAFNYCRKRVTVTGVTENPLTGLVRPPVVRRKSVMSPEEQQSLIDATSGCLHDILTVLKESGARPNELCIARIDQYRDGVITLEEHKEDDTGEDRIIYLSLKAREVVERLIAGREAGSIFRNSVGDPWKPATLLSRFRGLRKKLGIKKGCFPYAFRHRFASDALNKPESVNPALVAQLLGHHDLAMLIRHYSHRDPEALKRAIEEATK